MTDLQTEEVKKAFKSMGWKKVETVLGQRWCAGTDDTLYALPQSNDDLLLFCHNEIITAIEKLGYWWDYSSEISTFTIETAGPVTIEARGPFYVACIRSWNKLNKGYDNERI